MGALSRCIIGRLSEAASCLAEAPAPEVHPFEFAGLKSARIDEVIAAAESLTESGSLAIEYYNSALQRMLQVQCFAGLPKTTCY